MNKISVNIVLVKPRNPQNIGAVARVMANFGFKNLTIVSAHTPVWQEIVSAVGANDIIKNAKTVNSLDKAVLNSHIVFAATALKRRKVTKEIITLDKVERFLSASTAKTISIVFGNEKSGLSNDDINLCNAVLNIPTHTKQPSLNLAQAVAVSLWELSKLTLAKKSTKLKKNTVPASLKETEITIAAIKQLFRFANFKNHITDKTLENKIRQIIQKTDLDKKSLLLLKTLADKILRRSN